MRLALALLAAATACTTSAAPAKRAGQIVLEQGDQSSAATATFGASMFGTPVATRGDCTAFAGETSFGTFGAGELDVSGTRAPLQLLPLGEDPMVGYETATGQAVLFDAGATLTVTAQGGGGPDDLGPFREHVTAPAAITGHTPPAMLSRSTGTELTWDAATSTAMWILLLDFENPQQIVICTVRDSGHYVLPPSTFDLVAPTTQQVLLELARVDGQIELAGDTAVQLMAVQFQADQNPVPLGP